MLWIYLTLITLLVTRGAFNLLVTARMAPGRNLWLAGRHGESADAYRRAFETLPRFARFHRIKSLMMAANECIQAGRLEQAEAWAREALTLNPQGTFLILAHRVIGLSLSMRMRLDEAETPYLEGLRIARATRDAQQIGESLSVLAVLQLKRGHLAAAMETAREAEREHSRAARTALQVEYDCFRAQGRWQEAHDALERAAGAPVMPIVAARMAALLQLAHAMLEMQQGRHEGAQRYLDAARADLTSDEKLRVWWDAHAAWAAALAGDRASAETLIGRVAGALPCLQSDTSTQSMAAELMAHATFALGDWRSALAFIERAFALQPDVPSQVELLYHAGLCRRELGDAEGARAAFRRATETPCPSHYADLAREAMRAMNETEQNDG